MKTLNLTLSLSLKSLLLTATLLTCVGNVWGDNGDFYNMYISYSFAGNDGSIEGDDNGTGKSQDLGTLSSGTFKITGVYLKCWDDWGSNYKSSGGLLGYTNKSGSAQELLGFSRSNKVTNSNNYEWKNANPNLTLASYTDASGAYSFECWGKTWGDNWGDRYFPKSSGHYVLNYKIAPPAVSGFGVTVSGYLAGSGTSSDPYLVKSGQSLTLNVAGSKAHTDANSTLKYWINSGSKQNSNILTISNITATTNQTAVVHAQCINNSSSSLVGAESTSSTIYYKAVAVKDISVYIYVGGRTSEEIQSVLMNGCTPYIGTKSLSAITVQQYAYTGSDPKFTKSGDWLIYIFSNVTKVGNITCARTGANIFTGEITDDVYYNYDGTVLSGQCVAASGVNLPAWNTAPANGTAGGSMTASVSNPASLSGLSISWTSSNTTIAEVNSAGVISYNSAGNVTISAEVSWDATGDYCAGSHTLSQEITVSAAITPTITAASFVYNPITSSEGVMIDFTYANIPAGAHYRIYANPDYYRDKETADSWIALSGSGTTRFTIYPANTNLPNGKEWIVVVYDGKNSTTELCRRSVGTLTVNTVAAAELSAVTLSPNTTQNYLGSPIDITMSVTSKYIPNPVVIFFVNDGTTTYEVTATPGSTGARTDYITTHTAVFTADHGATYSVTAKVYSGLLLANFDGKDLSDGSWESVDGGSQGSATNPAKQSGNGSNNVRIITSASSNWQTSLYRFTSGISGYQYAHIRVYSSEASAPTLKLNDSKGNLTTGSSYSANTWNLLTYDNANDPVNFIFPFPYAASTSIYIDDIILSNEATMTIKATSVTASVTINDNHTVTVAAQNSYGTVSPTSVTAGYATASASINAAAVSGATFNGWTIPSGVTLASGNVNSETITLYATEDYKTITANFGIAPVTDFTYGYEENNANSWQQPISGDGTQANPYQVYKTKKLKLKVTGVTTSASDYSCIKVKYGSDSEQAYNSNGKVIDCTSTGSYSVSVNVYNKINSTEGTATTKTIYYTVIEAPTATLTSSASPLSVLSGTNITMTATLSTAVNTTNPYKFYFKAPGAADWSDTGCQDYKSLNTQTYQPSMRGTYQYYAFIKDQYDNIWQTNTLSLDVYEQYTVTFDANGGSCGTASKTVYSNGTYGDLPTATHTTSSFIGWFTAGGTQVLPTTNVTNYADHTLYAHYEQLFTVQVKYMCGTEEIAPSSTVTASATMSAGSISAPDIIGYTFSNWSATTGATIANTAEASTTVNLSSSTPVITANYTSRATVYFKNTLDWDTVFVTYDAYWDNNNGTGNYGKVYHMMTRIPNTDIFYDYIPTSYTNSWTGFIAFNNKLLLGSSPTLEAGTTIEQRKYSDGKYGNFNKGKVIYRRDFDPVATMFVPQKTNNHTYQKNGATYYSTDLEGEMSDPKYKDSYWVKYNSTGSGYSLIISSDSYNKTNHKFTTTTAGNYEYTTTINITSTSQHEFKLYRMATTLGENKLSNYFSNTGTMTKDNHSNWRFTNITTANCKFTPTATGEYTFTLSCTDEGLKISVEYPVSVGDYRLIYQDNVINKGHPSGIIRGRNNGVDTVSFYVRSSATKYLYLQKCIRITSGNPVWSTQGSDLASVINSVSENGVYNLRVQQSADASSATVTNVGKYTGDYYIRTDCADGGWNAYKTTEGNKITYSEYADQHENFTHYFTAWALSGVNVKFCIANDYSPALTDSLTGDTYLGGADDSHQTLPANANIRFMWNQKNNVISRAYISGSTNASDYFLVLRGNGSNKLYSAASGDGVISTNGNNNWALFSDNQNWVYEVNVYVEYDTYIKLTAKYNNLIQYFKGDDTETFDDTHAWKLVKGATDSRYHMQVVYDFKTNRLVAGWVPDSESTYGSIDLGSSVLFIRDGDSAAEQLQLVDESKIISNITNVITVLRVTKDNWNVNGGFFWFSLPYTCKISDVFGLGDYGADKDWVIQRYRGDLRAQQGWFQDSPTFWRNLKKTATLEANRGYVILLNHQPEYKHGTTYASLYFPSAEGQTFSFTKKTVSTTLPYNECTVCQGCASDPSREGKVDYDRRAEDSHWYVAGVPTFQNSKITTITPNEGITDKVHIKDKTPLYFYEWSYGRGGYGRSENYLARTTSTYDFLSTHAYMFQFAGTLTWQASISVAPNSIVARHKEDTEESFVEMEFQLSSDDTELDHTYITLADGATSDYDLGADLSKIVNQGAQIYSYAGSHLVAANVLPLAAEEVPLGIVFPETGEYQLSLAKGMPAGKSVSIYDAAESREYSLENPVTIYADSAHTSVGRYSVRIQKKQGQITTAADNTLSGTISVTQADGRLFISGIEGRAEAMLYDMTGKLLYRTLVESGEGIAAPQQGIYLMRVAGQTLKINVR